MALIEIVSNLYRIFSLCHIPHSWMGWLKSKIYLPDCPFQQTFTYHLNFVHQNQGSKIFKEYIDSNSQFEKKPFLVLWKNLPPLIRYNLSLYSNQRQRTKTALHSFDLLLKPNLFLSFDHYYIYTISIINSILF